MLSSSPSFSIKIAALVSGLGETTIAALDAGGVIIPTAARAAGPGRARRYSEADLYQLALVGALWRAGCPSAGLPDALGLAAVAGDGARLAVLHRGPVVLLLDSDELPANAAEVRPFDVRARVAELLRALAESEAA